MLFIINNLVKGFFPLCLLIWTIFMPRAGGYTFIGIYVAFYAYLFFIDLNKPKPNSREWSVDEIKVLRRYHLALRAPSGANIMSTQLNGFRWIGLVFFSPLLLWNQMWFVAAVNVISFFITMSISVRLDPFFFLSDAVNHGKIQFEDELVVLKEVAERLRGQAK